MINNQLLGSSFYARIRAVLAARGFSITQMAPYVGLTPSGLSMALKRNTIQHVHWLKLCDMLDLLPTDGIYIELLKIDLNDVKTETVGEPRMKYMAQKKKADTISRKFLELQREIQKLKAENAGKKES